MKATDSDTFYFADLETIRRIDCSTPRCRANGYCTGYLRLHDVIGWCIEYACPDCNSTGLRHTPDVRELVEALLTADDTEQRRLVEDYVATRPNTRNPTLDDLGHRFRSQTSRTVRRRGRESERFRRLGAVAGTVLRWSTRRLRQDQW